MVLSPGHIFAGPWLGSRWLPVVAGPFIGSVLGVLVRRLPRDQPVAGGRSHCESCGWALGPLDLLPVASFLALRGHCRHCGAAIAPMHLAIELAAAAVAASAALLTAGGTLWAGCGLGWTLLACGWIDWEQFWLPDALTLPLIVAGLGATWMLAPYAVADHAAAAAIGYALFRLIGLAYRRLRGFEGLGQGDAKLLAASGAWLGLAGLPLVILGAALLGLAAAAGLRLAGRTVSATTPIAFGPALAAATWLVWLLASGPGGPIAG